MPKITDLSGNVVEELPYTEEGVDAAHAMVNANPSLSIDYSPGGQVDAMERIKTNYAGDGTTGFNQIGMNPLMPNSPKKPKY